MSAAITYAPETPMHLIGYGSRALRPFHTHRVSAPSVPFHSLGYMGDGSAAAAQGTKMAAPVAGTVVTSLAASAGWGAWAGPVGAAVAVGIGLIAGLLAAHALRAKQAKNENSAVNIGVSGFDSDLRKIQQAFSSGQADLSTSVQAAQLVLQNYFSLVTPTIQPGRNGCNGGASCPSPASDTAASSYCKGNIGAACCVGCIDIVPSVLGPDGVIAALQGQSTAPEGHNVAKIRKVFPSKYGAKQRDAYALTFDSPASSVTAGSAVSAIEQSLGIGSGSSLVPIALVAVAAFLLLR